MATAGYLRKFERLITGAIIVMMSLVVALSVLDLAWTLVKRIAASPWGLIGADEVLDLFGLFLLVLIGLELLETIEAYFRQKEIRAEIIILVAMIALARKIIVLEVKDVSSASLLGIAALVVALGIAHALIRFGPRRTGAQERSPPPEVP